MSTQQSGDYQSIHDFIISQLGQHTNRDDLILEVCTRMGVRWPEAADLVAAVELEYSREVARRQGPLMLVLGGAVLLAGVALSGVALYFFAFEASFVGSTLLLDLQNSYVMGAALVTGIGMTAGSVYGLARVIGSMLNS
jgi:hypothetical protein